MMYPYQPGMDIPPGHRLSIEQQSTYSTNFSERQRSIRRDVRRGRRITFDDESSYTTGSEDTYPTFYPDGQHQEEELLQLHASSFREDQLPIEEPRMHQHSHSRRQSRQLSKDHFSVVSGAQTVHSRSVSRHRTTHRTMDPPEQAEMQFSVNSDSRGMGRQFSSSEAFPTQPQTAGETELLQICDSGHGGDYYIDEENSGEQEGVEEHDSYEYNSWDEDGLDGSYASYATEPPLTREIGRETVTMLSKKGFYSWHDDSNRESSIV